MTTTPPAIPLERPDPMPAGMLGMWLFLAGEAMFFAGLLSAFIVLQSVPGERALFLRSARVVSVSLTITALCVLAISIVAVHRQMPRRVIVILAAVFLVVQGSSCCLLLTHRTVVTSQFVFDGRDSWMNAYHGVRAPLPATLDLAQLMPSDLKDATPWGNDSAQDPATYSDVRVDQNYGPSRNNYFACYFLVTAAHAIHVIGGLLAIACLASRRHRLTHVQQRAMSLFWQFVNGVGLVSVVLLALG